MCPKADDALDPFVVHSPVFFGGGWEVGGGGARDARETLLHVTPPEEAVREARDDRRREVEKRVKKMRKAKSR